jgi:hypothetical protein
MGPDRLASGRDLLRQPFDAVGVDIDDVYEGAVRREPQGRSPAVPCRRADHDRNLAG